MCMIWCMLGIFFVVVLLMFVIVLLNIGLFMIIVYSMLGRCMLSLNCVVLLIFFGELRCFVGVLISLKFVGCFSVMFFGIGSFVVVLVSWLYDVCWLFGGCCILLFVVW